MNQWEFIWARLQPEEGEPYTENGKAMIDTQGRRQTPEPYEYINERGDQGWDVVSAFPSPDTGIIIILKRPKGIAAS